MRGLTIGDTVPDLVADSTHGKIKLHDYIGDSWTILFSHPADFTPVCTTELGKMAAYAPEFAIRGVKLVGVSCDDVQSHNDWIKDIEAYTPGCKVTYPILADPNRDIIKQLNMVDPDEKDNSGKPLPSRALHMVGPDKKVKLSFLYPATTGRNMDEVVRVLDSLQKASRNNYKIATPVDWKQGDPVVISPSVSDEQAKEMFPQGYKTVELPSKKDYLRFTDGCSCEKCKLTVQVKAF
ncbi:1-Cys peroxiredoxin [Juglans microcarpa x Juglans regia]|uniref:1-Cys peroxiredoxin n=1 Tax=Juglans microcarpa x Juglans regia TaxID=2249226 RepID=UPI001B7DCC32|nr:1-Cys peroxiredoxin [Juglans microcarpa x Juglans regia]